MSASLAHEVALQLGLHGGVEVRVLALTEAARVRLAWDMCRQPWFQCHNLVSSSRAGLCGASGGGETVVMSL